jgi:hypothetical protein
MDNFKNKPTQFDVDFSEAAAPLVSKHKQDYAVLSPLLIFLLSQQPVFADTDRMIVFSIRAGSILYIFAAKGRMTIVFAN